MRNLFLPQIPSIPKIKNGRDLTFSIYCSTKLISLIYTMFMLELALKLVALLYSKKVFARRTLRRKTKKSVWKKVLHLHLRGFSSIFRREQSHKAYFCSPKYTFGFLLLYKTFTLMIFKSVFPCLARMIFIKSSSGYKHCKHSTLIPSHSSIRGTIFIRCGRCWVYFSLSQFLN